jgi:Cys-rich four helix bundle protein (predicted Tat secretion target)
MERRNTLKTLALSAGGLALMGATNALAADHSQHAGMTNTSKPQGKNKGGFGPSNPKLALAAAECLAICEECTAHCQRMMAQGDTAMAQCLRTTLELAPLCASVKTLASYGSEYTKAVAKVCIEACQKCAEACKEHAAHHEICKKCHDECLQCIEACKAA